MLRECLVEEEGNRVKKQKSSTGDLNLFHLTWPIFLEVFLFMLMGIVDTFMLSSLSDDAVSGVGAANQYIHIAILLLEVVAAGASIVVAQFLGSKLIKEASRVAALSVTLNLVIGVILSIIYLIFAKTMMVAMNLQGDVLDYAQSYLSIVGGAIFLQAIINSLAAVIRVHGWTKQTMYVSLGMNVIHVIGNYVLIFGKFGFPEMGVEGAAISSIGSRFLAMLVFFWLFYQVMEVRVKWKDYFAWSKEYVGKIMRIGLPAAFEQILYQAAQIVFLFYITYLGAESLAARQYAHNISMFTYLFAIAIGMGTAIIVGRYVGAGRSEDAYTQLWKSVRYAMTFTVTAVTLVVLFRKPIVSIFTDNPDVIQLAAQVLVLGLALETGRTLNIVIINSLRAAGDARFPVLMGAISMIGISLPLGYFFVFILDWGLVGVWAAIAIDEWTRGLIMLFRWKSKAWKRYALVKVPDNTKQAESY